MYVTDVHFVSCVDEVFGPGRWEQCCRYCAWHNEKTDDVICCPAAELEGQRWQRIIFRTDTSISCLWLVSMISQYLPQSVRITVDSSMFNHI